MPKHFHLLRTILPGLFAAVLLASLARAQEKPAERTYTFTEETSDELVKYKAATDAKPPNYELAISIIDARLAKIVDKNSYDYGMLLEYKAQALLQKGDFLKALEPMELGLSISDAHTPTYSDDRVAVELCYLLAQIYFQQAVGAKTSATSIPFYAKADLYMTRWMKLTKKPNPEAMSFYASVLYNYALAADPEHPDMDKINRALVVVDQCLHLSTHPKDNLYLLKLVCFQQLNRNEESSELLELLVSLKPENKTYWAQLASFYVNLNLQVRAILTFERAQAQGFMNAPKDNYNLVGIYFNLGQYEHASVLLEKGLHDGTLENDQKNWELLTFCYQQLNRDYKAIDTLKQASKLFPASSQLEFLIAQIYFALDKNEEALAHLQACVAQGGGNKPSQTYMFLAYVAYALQKYDVALAAADKAIGFPESHDKGVSMKKTIENAVANREDKLKKM
jgi:Tfp pilus assembly protein PilF